MNINLGNAHLAIAARSGLPDLWGTLLVPWSGHVADHPRPMFGKFMNPIVPALNQNVVSATAIQQPAVNLQSFNSMLMLTTPLGKQS